ncbi:MAG: Prophage antirepressor [Candidatus Moranbacteria bacterium GW2011_GWE2_35_2-]|nr:MAG: Prophage antirepressor [Candidatus Moranbacteria bacterium GW2011_GWE2_35_2-]KKQ21766.1 MAG: Prophage antirepressor [Candidatus Moranbacteria bacterium GW2011_GWF2_37_11]KKQ31206.1 MAG: Prophage antirepressor [Candidatus Moranbacteria bacterium GW2011_GWE1_37_24]
MKNKTKIALFKGKKVRKIIHNNEWWFSVVDVVEALTDSVNARDYWYKMKIRVKDESGFQLSTICRQLKLESPDGKMRETDCANTEGIFRIIQSIPSPKAEPFKMWLARVGYERVQEIEDPELATKRTVAIYKAKGYPDDWIDKRMRGIAVRKTLTNEWEKRGAQEDTDFAILTNDIMQGAFDMSVNDYKKFKGIKRENLRDHMADLELILTMLGEATTTKITKDRDSKGVPKLRRDAKDGGAVAGRTRKDIEKISGKKVISKNNFLPKRNNEKLK